ncbi:MAG: hypothetical protein IJE65_01900 [Clostridia bacterium]|nr:hypothetical protein [Clostridia bacterium]
MKGKLKTVLFGFDKKETLNYIENYQRESQRKITTLESEISALKEQAEILKSENDAFETELNSAKKRLEDTEKEVAAIKKASDEKDKKYIDEIDETYKQLEIMRDNMKSSLDSFIKQVENINNNLENTKNAIDTEHQIESVNDKIMYI